MGCNDNNSINKTYIIDSVTTSGGTSPGPINFAVETLSGNTSYLGYGDPSACKILRVITTSGQTYTSFWSNGEETLDKLWADRYIYLYF